MDGIFTLLYLLLLLLLTFITIYYYKKFQRIDIFLVFTFSYTVYYCLVPLIISLFNDSIVGSGGYLFFITNSTFGDKIYAFIYTVLGYLMFFIGYRYTPSWGKLKLNKLDIYNLKGKQKKILNRNLSLFGWMMLLIGGFSFMFIVYKLGGIINALQLADYLRNPNVSSTRYLEQNVLFLKTLGGLVLGSPYVFLAKYVIDKKRVTKIIIIFSFILGLLYALFQAGKFVLITYLLGFIIYILFKKKRVKISKLLVIGLIIILAIPYLDFLFSYFTSKGTKQLSELEINYLGIINQFAFPYSNVLIVQKFTEYFGIRWGIDLINWTWNVMPSFMLRFLGLNFTPTLEDQLTRYYSIFKESSGGTPSDLLTLILCQFNVFGLLLMVFIGSVFKKINSTLIFFNYKYFSFLYIPVLTLIYSFVFNSEMDNIIKYRMYNLVILIMLIIVKLKLANKTFKEGDHH